MIFLVACNSYVDLLALSDPAWKDPTDAQMYAECRDQHYLYQFLMALRNAFEPLHGQLLQHTPLSTLDKVVCDLVQTRLHILRS